VERRCIDELWRKKWRRKKVGRGRFVEEAKGVRGLMRRRTLTPSDCLGGTMDIVKENEVQRNARRKIELQVADECGRV
jgi:hypothetical protein